MQDVGSVDCTWCTVSHVTGSALCVTRLGFLTPDARRPVPRLPRTRARVGVMGVLLCELGRRVEWAYRGATVQVDVSSLDVGSDDSRLSLLT